MTKQKKISKESNNIHIAITFDENFLIAVYTCITSILLNNKKKIIFHAIAPGVPIQEKKKVTRYIAESGGSIKFYEIDESFVNTFAVVPDGSKVTITSYFRLFFPHLISSRINKLLYLDVDLVVINSLTDLYNINLGEYSFGAVAERGLARPDLGIEKGNYFNNGVMLINTSNWKRQQITETTIQFIIDYPDKIDYLDQDAMNGVLANKRNNWMRLDDKFNLVIRSIVKSKLKSRGYLDDKVIIHYNRPIKPWSIASLHPLKHIFDEYLIVFFESNHGKEILKQDINYGLLYIITKIFFKQNIKRDSTLFLAFVLLLCFVKVITANGVKKSVLNFFVDYLNTKTATITAEVKQTYTSILIENMRSLEKTYADVFGYNRNSKPKKGNDLLRFEWMNILDTAINRINVVSGETLHLDLFHKTFNALTKQLYIAENGKGLLFFLIHHFLKKNQLANKELAGEVHGRKTNHF